MTKQEFIDVVIKHIDLSNEDAIRISTAVLLTLRSQLSVVEIYDIYETLPEDIDVLWEGSLLQRIMSRLQSLREMDKDDFIEQVREAADIKTTKEAEQATEAVFLALKEAIPDREVDHITDDLPDDLSDLWKAA